MIRERGFSPREVVARLIDRQEKSVPVKRQADLLGISRSSVYYRPEPVDEETLSLMNRIDKIHTDWPVYGARKISAQLKRETGIVVGRKRARALMEKMGLSAIYPKPRLSLNGKEHPVYPYRLSGVKIIRPNQVWGADITYIKMVGGFVYLVCFLDWYSRFVLGWKLSTTLTTDFVLSAGREALTFGFPEITNVDQGVQFTDLDFIGMWDPERTKISMDHRGRCFDNIFTERLWRTLKYEEVYLKEYLTVRGAESSIGQYLKRYNYERLHAALNYKTPAEIYFCQETKLGLQDKVSSIVIPNFVS